MDSTEQWIERAQQGNGEAYGRIVLAFQDMAYGVAYGYLGEQQSAYDAAQDAFIEAYTCLPKLRDACAFPAWFRRIVIKQCDRQIRKRQPEQLSEAQWKLIKTQAPNPDQMLEQLQNREAVRRAIDALPTLYREVTVLFYLNGRSLKDISARLTLPISTVKKRLFTARQQLKEQLNLMSTENYKPSEDQTFAAKIQFFIALKNDDLIQIRQLLRQNPDLLEAKTEWGVASDGWYWPLGKTALHYAAAVGNEPLTAVLVEAGANVNVLDQGGATPLKEAVHMGQTQTATWLLENGADPNLATNNGLTPLHSAVIRNWPEMVDLLITFGANAEISDSQSRAPADWAVVKKLPKLAKKLGAAADAADPVVERTAATIWETGIKILDLVAPLKWGGRNGLFTPISGIGADVMIAELIHSIGAHCGGTAVQVGLKKGGYTAESRMLQWRNYGVENFVELFYGDETDSDAKQAHLVQQAVKRTAELAKTQPVLLIVYTHIHLTDEILSTIGKLADLTNVTILFAGNESIGAEPEALANLDAAFTFDRQRALQGLWPTVDAMRSYSNQYASEAHQAIAETAVRACRKYQDLHVIYQYQGMAGFEMSLYGEAERVTAIRARRLHHYLAQPLFTAEPWSATPGAFVPLTETLSYAQSILSGEFDDEPEEKMAQIGEWAPRLT
ncbi:MAG: sigma-70 family RNA polymerase sigma factor [Chloroflexota bacterium]